MLQKKNFRIGVLQDFVPKGKNKSENAEGNLSKKGKPLWDIIHENEGLFVRRIAPKPQLGWSSLSYHGNLRGPTPQSHLSSNFLWVVRWPLVGLVAP